MSSSVIRALVLEDNANDFHLLRAALRRHWTDGRIEHVVRLADALEQLERNHFDVVLIDLCVPDSFGVGTVSAIRAAAPESALVVITGGESTEHSIESLQIGAQDFLEKQDINSAVLVRSIRYAMERQAAMTALAKANRDLEAFTNALSHDLRSPLSTIQGYASLVTDMLGEGSLSEVRHAIDVIHRACRHAIASIDSLLELVRIGGADMTLEPVDLNVVLEDLRLRMTPRADERRATITIDDDLPPACGHVTYIARVLENLIGNALRYACAEPGGTVRIGARIVNDEVEVFVRDNGPGIDESSHQCIFDVFHRLSSDGEGAGIGLSFCKRVIDEHGGRIWVDSTPGDGATFRFTLPMPAARPTRTAA